MYNSYVLLIICIVSMCIKTHNIYFFFFFNDTATTEIYTLSLHDALPISTSFAEQSVTWFEEPVSSDDLVGRSEEHTSELQSPCNLVCRLLLEKKKKSIFAIAMVVITTHPAESIMVATIACVVMLIALSSS